MITTWHDSEVDSSPVKVDPEDKSPPKFPVCETWNKCIALCQSVGLEVPCDAIIRATDENLLVTLQEPQDLVEQAGAALRDELLRLGDCPTGDVRVTGAFGLPFFKHIIHAVPPLYVERFHTMSLSSLHSTYKNILNSAIELQLRTLLIPPLFIVPGNFPLEDGCRLVIKTLRRYFDHFGPEPFVDMIVLICPNHGDYALYCKMLAIYFPRNAEEERLSLALNVEEDDGFGGPVMKERCIPIRVLIPNEAEDNDDDGRRESESSRSATVLGAVSAPPSDLKRVQKIRKHGQYSDKTSGGKKHSSSNASSSSFSQPSTSSSQDPSPLVERALKADLTALVASGFLSVVGTDRLGRHVVVMIARELDLRKFDINQVLFYFVRVLEPIVSRSSNDFVVVYCHTLAGDHAMTGEQAGALVKALIQNDSRYLARLRAIYVLHPDWRTRLSLTYAKLAFLPTEVGDRIVTLNCCRSFVELLLPITPRPGSSNSNGMDALLPEFIVDYDNSDHRDHSH